MCIVNVSIVNNYALVVKSEVWRGFFVLNDSTSVIKPSKCEENICYFLNILNMREEQNTKLG